MAKPCKPVAAVVLAVRSFNKTPRHAPRAALRTRTVRISQKGARLDPIHSCWIATIIPNYPNEAISTQSDVVDPAPGHRRLGFDASMQAY